jgi:hypothetical protein
MSLSLDKFNLLQADGGPAWKKYEQLRQKQASEAEKAFFDLAVAAEAKFYDAVVAAETARAAALAEADHIFRDSIAAASAKTGVSPKAILKGPAAHARAASSRLNIYGRAVAEGGGATGRAEAGMSSAVGVNAGVHNMA